MKRFWPLIITGLAMLMLIHTSIITSTRPAPETVLIRILSPDNRTPELGAECKADITTEQGIQEDQQLQEIEDLYSYIDIKKFDTRENKGFYALTTGLKDYQGQYEIRIVCVSQGNKGVSYTILNNTNMPCELADKGRFVIC